MRTLLLCAVLTGMRRGEVLGLKWEDVDLEGNRIHVRRSLWRGKFVTPSLRRSRRAIDMAPTLKTALARLPSRFKGETVFTSPEGGVMDPDNFSSRDWARVLRRSKLQRIRVHRPASHVREFSHHRAGGAHPKYIQAQLSATPRSRRPWTGTGTSCPRCTKQRRASSTGSSSGPVRVPGRRPVTARRRRRMTRRAGHKMVRPTTRERAGTILPNLGPGRLRGLDLNQRPLGYEPRNPVHSLRLLTRWVHASGRKTRPYASGCGVPL